MFSKVDKNHILLGIRDFEERGLPNEFGPSSTYDVVIDGKSYPPKAVMAYANYHASGREIENYFKGGEGTECFNAFINNGFNVVKKENKNMHQKLYLLKQQFLDTWPIEKLERMTLEEYTNLDKTSFCYWVEAITTDLGSIWGGSAYKFGIFKRRELESENYNEKRKTDGVYAWYGKYGDTKEEVFENIKSIVISIAKSVQSNNLEDIDKIDLGNGLKWKIAFLYGDFNCLNVFKLDALRVIASNLGIEYSNKTPISQFHRKIVAIKSESDNYFTWSHELWKQYETGLIDVKRDFALWLNKNTFESYRAYLGYSTEGIEKRLDEINGYFDDVNFFLVDPKKINDLVNTILFMMSKKERVKNPNFVEYDSKNSNGIPKAILGKNNYIKYLKEKFEYSTPNYWIFQGNPSIYNITEALYAGHLKSWKVAAHKESIRVGDKIILWQTGGNAGCYAFAEVASEVEVFKEDEIELRYYSNPSANSEAERVKIRIIKNLADAPILWSDIKDNLIFSNFKAGNQGTNFSATEEEYQMLLEISEARKYPEMDAEKELLEIIGFHARHDVLDFFEFLDAIMERFNITIDDERVVTGTSHKNLNLTIGQRYCFNLFPPFRSKGRFGIISSHRLNDTSDPFKGNGEQPFYTHFNGFQDVLANKNATFSAIENELNRSTKSSFSEFNNPFYRKAIFDKEYRKLILGTSASSLNEASLSYKKMPSNPTNQILYGPPGTGKTYYLKDQLFDRYISKETSISKEQHFETVVSKCSWWQVIAIALLDLKKAKVSDIFNHEWVQKKASLSNSKTIRPTLWGQLQSHTTLECDYVNVTNRQQPLIFNKTEDSYWEILEEEVEELVPELFTLRDSVENYNPSPNKKIKHYDFVTFHQSFAYEDFIEGIKPILPETDVDLEESKDLGYKIEDGVFKSICIRAKNDPDNRYAIFIDEINRGNVSAIFGELITLIEVDKRLGKKNEIVIKLPYSKKEFGVPSNLDIYGTMNTADRSVEALDTALRRRFEFKEMMPDCSVIEDEWVEGIQLSEVLKRINQRIELLIDRDHTIGHSYFVNVNTPKKLSEAFNNKIVPLLQEYFYGDYGKIGLVLGKGFVEILKNDKIGFANFTYENADDFKMPSYNLKQVTEENVLDAVAQLLGIKEMVSE
ncbi:EVE domain-containing protein [uncultured Gelidibacter sp.]|uniref:EVE domain-containing protein n=1 Tax=uncultured Gelidibacter sp. TaxID=259318 RepID=UPI002625E98F|nr:EVE domain-containing protein [uncultured Gelidibacter sp.]